MIYTCYVSLPWVAQLIGQSQWVILLSYRKFPIATFTRMPNQIFLLIAFKVGKPSIIINRVLADNVTWIALNANYTPLTGFGVVPIYLLISFVCCDILKLSLSSPELEHQSSFIAWGFLLYILTWTWTFSIMNQESFPPHLRQ